MEKSNIHQTQHEHQIIHKENNNTNTNTLESNTLKNEEYTQEQKEFISKFYEGKIFYKLPSKYPENFTTCESYVNPVTKKNVALNHRPKIKEILTSIYNTIKPVLKKFNLSLSLLIESDLNAPKVAATQKIKLDFTDPSNKNSKLYLYTYMIKIKIRNVDSPQDQKKILNKTTIFAIILHELAHLRHMNHGVEFGCFLKEIYRYADKLGIFPTQEEHMIPSIRKWEREIFETKGKISDEDIRKIFAEEEEVVVGEVQKMENITSSTKE